jgi:hypothetical protein
MVIYNGHPLVQLAFLRPSSGENSPEEEHEAAAHEEKCAIHIANIGRHHECLRQGVNV